MKVYVLPADAHGCGHYRLIWPADVLKRQGHQVIIIEPKPGQGFLAKTAANDDGSETLTSVQVPADADVLVLQRPAHPLQPQMIQMLRANGIAVVIDMDDDMSRIDPDNVAFHMYRPRSGSPFSWKWATESCKVATLVTTSTKTLQKVYAPRNNGIVIDNYVPAAYLAHPKPTTEAFGWPGTVKSHPNDPQVMGRSVQNLIDDGYKFQIVGGSHGVMSAFRVTKEPPSTGTVGLDKWAAVMAASFDVGVIPLASTSFNTSKSRLKGIEMMAIGVPWVASPREEYRKLARESGVGLLADTPKEWHQRVKLLMSDDVLRKEQAEAGRQFMQSQTYEANAWRWIEAWQYALDIQRS